MGRSSPPPHIIGDYLILLPRLGYAVDLNSEQNRNAVTMQLPSQQHDRRPSPTMAKEDDMRLTLLVITQISIMIAIKQAQDSFVSFFTAAVLEDFHVGARRRFAAQALGQLHRTMMRIVMPHEPAGKSHQNVVDLRGGLGFDRAIRRKSR